MRIIESAANPAVRRVADLRKRRHRREQGRVLIEGTIEVERAVGAGIAIEFLYVADDAEPSPELLATAESVIRLTGSAASRAFVRERGGDVLAVGIAPSLELSGLPATDLVVLAESIEKPGNLGAMLRTADAAGAGAFLVCDPTTDPLNPNVIRASLGTVFTVPLAICSLAEAIEWSHRHGLSVMALDPGGEPLYGVDLTGPSVLAAGAEHAGISQNLRTAADQCLSIPMAGSVDSLNAATALAIGLFEAVRQRSQA